MIMLALLVLCGGTFLYQRWRKQQEDKNNPEKDKNVNDINNVPHPVSIIYSLENTLTGHSNEIILGEKFRSQSRSRHGSRWLRQSSDLRYE